MDVMTAARHLYRHIGIEQVALWLGKSPVSIRHEVDKNYSTAKIGLEDAVEVSIESGDLSILNAFAGQMNCMVTHLPDLSEESPGRDAVCEMAQAVGKYFSDVGLSMADNRITDNELEACTNAMGQMIRSAQHVHSVMLSMNRSAKKPETRLRDVAAA